MFPSHDREEERARLNQEAEAESQRAFVNNWETRLQETEKEIPDIREKGAKVGETFATAAPEMAEYLSGAIMSMEEGPQVLAYLADNPQEARVLATADPLNATLQLGALKAAFVSKGSSEGGTPPKVSNAQEPPPQVNKGTSGKVSIRPDTDNLEDFAKLFDS